MPEQPLHTYQYSLTGLKHLPSFVEEVAAFINSCTHLEQVAQEQLLFYCKTIVSELLTNTIKHAEEKETTLEIAVFSNAVHIIRRDCCPPMHFSCTVNGESLQWPLPSHFYNTNHILYKDDINALSIRINEQGHGIFHAWQNADNFFDINTLHEHFGLLMIALSSRLFTYLYDSPIRENRFIVIVDF